MTEFLLVIIAIFSGLIFKVLYDSGKRDIFGYTDFSNYPVFDKQHIVNARVSMEKSLESYTKTHNELFEENQELKKKEPFQPSKELKDLMNRYLMSKQEYENEKKLLNFMIEGNISVARGLKKIAQVEEEWQNHIGKLGIADILKIDKDIEEWEKNLKQGKNMTWLKQNWFRVVILIILISLIGGWFYWYEWKPAWTRKACAVKIIEHSTGVSSDGIRTAYLLCMAKEGVESN